MLSSQFFRPLSIILALFISTVSAADYFPSRSTWQSLDAEKLGLNQTALDEAVEYAKQNEYSGAKDLRIAILDGFKREPFHYLAGPVKKRGGPAGLIIKNGYIVANWGDLERVDMTFSVTKSYLSTVAGLAVDKQLITNVDDLVSRYVWDGKFDGEHNQKIRWRHLLDQSSDWSGQLFGMQDWADRPPTEGGLDDWRNRSLQQPGTVMEYNDVRVNLLAYSLLQVMRRPLPEILKKHIMDPIGASSTWRWQGYDHAWVTIDGLSMQSVTGGGHSGGGIFINTLDQARFGLLILNNGKWQGKQLVSESWLKQATTPSPAHSSYGFMWWLNQGPRKWHEVEDEHLFYAAGFGGNYIVIDQKRKLMVVTRWLEPGKIGPLMQKVLAATET